MHKLEVVQERQHEHWQDRAVRQKELAEGPWLDEPDHVEYRITFSDLSGVVPAMLHRNGMGALCGYVGVPPGHPWRNTDVTFLDREGPDCHGGVTYASLCQGELCHVPRPGESHEVFWLGFDCSHAGDLAPTDAARARDNPPQHFWVCDDDVYRDRAYVEQQLVSMARQALEAR